MFGFWVCQGLTLRRIPVFVNLSLLWRWTSTYKNLKGWLSQKCVNFSLFSFKKCLYHNDFWSIGLGDLNIILRCMKRFFRKVPRKLQWVFFLKLRFLKIRLLVTWLECLWDYRRDENPLKVDYTGVPFILTAKQQYQYHRGKIWIKKIKKNIGQKNPRDYCMIILFKEQKISSGHEKKMDAL